MPYYDYFNFENEIQLILDIHNLGLSEFNPTLCGMEENLSDNFWGPGFRSSYHIHFVTSGKGFFENSYGRFDLKAGQGFFFIPGERVYYKADHNDPWTYIWLGFKGNGMSEISKRTGLSPSNPIFKYDKSFDIMTDFANLQYMKSGREYYFISILYRLFSTLSTENNAVSDSKAEMIVDYILQNISDNITVDSLARQFKLDRRYLSRMFTKEMKISPQQFIMSSKMNIALDLLKSKPYDSSVADIARSIGYLDPLSFSKAFKKFFGLSPREILKGKTPKFDYTNVPSQREDNPFRKR